MSAKNTLQELYQKQGKPLPIYKCRRCGGVDHAPLFEAKILLPDGDEYVGTGSTKKKAGENVAKQVLEKINLLKKIHKPVYKSLNPKPGEQVCILVDLENKPKIPEELASFSHPKIDVIAFASTEHHTIREMKNNQVQVVEVPCTRKNGADVGMTLFAGLLLYKHYTKFIIVSGDSFGYCLADCIQNIEKMVEYKDTPPRAVCCKTMEGILKEL